jgi:hypothetical protein
MGEFKVIKCKIKDETLVFGNKIFYTLIYEVDGVKYKYDMFTYANNRLTEEEFILKIKTEWENTK